MNIKIDGLKVLIVDDEERNRKLLGDLVKFNGDQVIYAAHGQEALEILMNEHVDVMLLDLIMPIIDGIQVMKILKRKKLLSFLSVIIVSDITNTETRTIAFDNGAFGILHKPIVKQELFEVLNEIRYSKLKTEKKA